jgi:hypothetical protein
MLDTPVVPEDPVMAFIKGVNSDMALAFLLLSALSGHLLTARTYTL